MADASTSSLAKNPALIALAGWLVPGAGYLLLGQRARGLTVGITIIVLFFLGLLVGGVRALDVPGYGPHGKPLVAGWVGAGPDKEGNKTWEPAIKDTPPADDWRLEGWVLTTHPFEEIRAKPWSIAQVMIGPIDLFCDWWSVRVSQPSNPLVPHSPPIAARSHSRLNELGVLYTAVAGMLNLLAIIDSSHRTSGEASGQTGEK
ncbi:MAG TPA: DUF6677 family protein [Tepidisphaeraceae bacterium]|nr:DUF6677 family protein [Tepidisphaeraceae bacterium]